MFKQFAIKDILKVPAHILSHVVIIAISAGIALSFPIIVGSLSEAFLTAWAMIGNEKIFLLIAETVLAILLIIFFNYLG